MSRCSTGLKAVPGCLVGVYHGVLRQSHSAVAEVEIGGGHVAVVHETGRPRGRECRSSERFPDCEVLVFGLVRILGDDGVGPAGAPVPAPLQRAPRAGRTARAAFVDPIARTA